MLFEHLGFSEVATKQAVWYKQINKMEALTKLTDKHCNNIICRV